MELSPYRLFEPNEKLTSTCVEAPGSLEHLIDLAGQVLYKVKKKHKERRALVHLGKLNDSPHA